MWSDISLEFQITLSENTLCNDLFPGPLFKMHRFDSLVLGLLLLACGLVSPLWGQSDSDSCALSSGVVRCPKNCSATFALDAPVLRTAYKLAISSKSCSPTWKAVLRVIPGLMVSASLRPYCTSVTSNFFVASVKSVMMIAWDAVN